MKIVGKFKYNVDDNNDVFVWDLENPNENDAPFLLQPDYPDGTPWTNEEAWDWADKKISHLLDPDNVPEPTNGPVYEMKRAEYLASQNNKLTK